MLKGIVKNATWLGVVQALNFAVPVLTLPVVVRAFGPEIFGSLATITAYANYVALVTSYGFFLSGPRTVAKLRGDLDRLSQSVGSILAAQLFLAIVSATIFACLLPILPYGSGYRVASLIILAKLVAGELAGQWIFIGLEDMQNFAIIQLIPRLLAVAAIVAAVRQPSDLYLYLGLDSGAAILSAGLSVILLHRLGVIKWRTPDRAAIWSVLRHAGPLFLTTVSMNIYKTTSVLVIAFVLGTTAAGSFALAYRLMAAGAQVLGPITLAIYPFICRISTGLETEGDGRTKRVFFCAIMALSALLSMALFVLSPLIIYLVGGQQFPQVIGVLRLMAFAPLAMALSNIFGMQTMLPLNMDRELSWVVSCAAVIGLPALALVSMLFGLDGAAITVLGVEFFVAIGMAAILSSRMRILSLFVRV